MTATLRSALGRMPALFLVLACAGLPLGARADDPRAIPLVDQTGATFRLSDLGGRPALVTFVATRCSDACPLANAAFAKLRVRLDRDRVAARLVTITLDPAYDTPFVMSQVARGFHADARDWIFASGSPENVSRLMRSLGVVAVKGRSGVPDQHSSFVYVLDRSTRLSRTLLLSTDMAEDAERALAERSLAGGGRL
jgi:cytochrome oxidase Cu insertion factor (SCO1/SenC/PrrC family)